MRLFLDRTELFLILFDGVPSELTYFMFYDTPINWKTLQKYKLYWLKTTICYFVFYFLPF